MVQYLINNTDFKQFGVWVQESSGILDLPKAKEIKKANWAEYHGTIPDLRNIRYEERIITLKCFLVANNPAELVGNFNKFLALISGGLKRLQINVTADVSLHYDVYLSSNISLRKKWSEGKMVGEFDITLTEPEPIKKVIMFQTAKYYNVFELSLTSSDALSVSYGDGTSRNDVFGENIQLNHTYSADGTYYIIIKGNVEKIEDLTTNGTIIWEH